MKPKRKAYEIGETTEKKTKKQGDLAWMDLLAMAAACMVVTPFATMPFVYLPMANAAVRVLATLLFFAIGWGCQQLVCVALRYTRQREGSGYEQRIKYYHIGLALPAWGVAALTFFLLPRAVDAWLYHYAATTTSYLYDEFSIFPTTAGAVAAVLILLGSAVRLYPYTRILSMRFCMTYIALFFIGFVMGGGGVSAFCLFVFAVCAGFLLNQCALEREVNTLTIPDVPHQTRMGGVSAVLWLGSIFLGVCAVLTVIVGGGMMVGRMLLFMLLRNMFADDGQTGDPYYYSSSEEVVGQLKRYLVQGDESPWLNYLLMTLFLLGIIGLIIFFALRHNTAVRRWLHELWLRFTAFIDWLFGASERIYYRAHDDGEEVSYRDTRRKMERAAPAIGAEATKMGWREFRARLVTYPTDEAKLTYAYAVLAAVLRTQPNFPILRSDTPRRLTQKVVSRGRHEQLREITAAYEQVVYAERSPDPAKLEAALNQACHILREYWG